MCIHVSMSPIFFFFNDTATTEIYTLSLHDALPICTLRFHGIDYLRSFAGVHNIPRASSGLQVSGRRAACGPAGGRACAAPGVGACTDPNVGSRAYAYPWHRPLALAADQRTVVGAWLRTRLSAG